MTSTFKKIPFRRLIVALSILAFAFGGCSEEDIAAALEDEVVEGALGFDVDLTDPNATYTGLIKVLKEDQTPLVGATVALDDQTITSDGEGFLRFDNIKVGEAKSIRIRAKGYMSYPVQLDYTFVGQGNGKVQMEPVEVSVTLNAASGGSVNGSNVGVQFEGASFVDADGKAIDGDVTINLASVNTETDVFSEVDKNGNPIVRTDMNSDRVPKGYLLMKQADGSVRSVLPESVLVVEMEDKDGNEVQLAKGKPADIRLGLPSFTNKKPGDTMVLSSYDEKLSMWKDEGTCTVKEIPKAKQTSTSVLECVGKATHFTQYTASDTYGVPRCVKFNVKFTPEVAAEIKTFTGRRQTIEYLDATKELKPGATTATSKIGNLKDWGLDTGLSQCVLGPNALYWARVKVSFTTPDKKIKTYTSHWVRPNAKSLKSGEDARKLCDTCEKYSVTLGGEFVVSTPPAEDNDGDGYKSDVDCDDTNAGISPGQSEHVCSKVDLNCDDKVWTTAFELPETTDTVGVAYWNNTVCKYKKSYSYCANYATSDKGGNRLDENCVNGIEDIDGDGFTKAQKDCDDENKKRFPGATEIANDGIDQDCNGADLIEIDECSGDNAVSCSANATCFDEDESTTDGAAGVCTCEEGYVGDGETCNASSEPSFSVGATITPVNGSNEGDDVRAYFEMTPTDGTKYEIDCFANGSFTDHGSANSGAEFGHECQFGAVDGPATRKVILRVTKGGEEVTAAVYANVVTVTPSYNSDFSPSGIYSAATPVQSVAVSFSAITDSIDDMQSIQIDCAGNGTYVAVSSGLSLSTNHTCTYAGLADATQQTVNVRWTDEDGDTYNHSDSFTVQDNSGGGGGGGSCSGPSECDPGCPLYGTPSCQGGGEACPFPPCDP